VLDTVTDWGFQEAFQKWRRRWTDVYMRAGTTSRVMAIERIYVEFYYFYSVSPEYLDRSSSYFTFGCNVSLIFILVRREITNSDHLTSSYMPGFLSFRIEVGCQPDRFDWNVILGILNSVSQIQDCLKPELLPEDVHMEFLMETAFSIPYEPRPKKQLTI
jgi:hypothetical protein